LVYWCESKFQENVVIYHNDTFCSVPPPPPQFSATLLPSQPPSPVFYSSVKRLGTVYVFDTQLFFVSRNNLHLIIFYKLTSLPRRWLASCGLHSLSDTGGCLKMGDGFVALNRFTRTAA
jgi:hypothetical protein